MKTPRRFRQILQQILQYDISTALIFMAIITTALLGCGDTQSEKQAAGDKMSGVNPQFSSIESQKGDIICDSTNYMDVSLSSQNKVYQIQVVEESPVLVQVPTTSNVTVEIVDSESNRLVYCERAYAIVVDGGDGSLSLVPIQGS